MFTLFIFKEALNMTFCNNLYMKVRIKGKLKMNVCPTIVIDLVIDLVIVKNFGPNLGTFCTRLRFENSYKSNTWLYHSIYFGFSIVLFFSSLPEVTRIITIPLNVNFAKNSWILQSTIKNLIDSFCTREVQ